MPRIRARLLKQEAGRELRSYIRGRLWYWAARHHFTLSTDYAIHLLNLTPRDPLGLCIGKEVALLTGQGELAEKCEKASKRVAFLKGVEETIDLFKNRQEPSYDDMQAWTKDMKLLRDQYSEGSGAPEEERLTVSSSVDLESTQKMCTAACLRVSREPLVEVVSPPQSPYGRGLYATKALKAGTCLLVDEPFLVVPRSRKKICAHCLAPVSAEGGDRKLLCPHCEEEVYCSVACLEAAWESNHSCCCASQNPSYAEWSRGLWASLESSDADAWRDSNSSFRAALACLAVGKLCAKATVCQSHPLNLEGLSHLSGTVEFHRSTALREVGHLAVVLSSALRQPYLFMEEMLSLFALLQTNEFIIDRSIVLYPLLSLLNHSCMPNCTTAGPSVGSPAKRQLIAVKDIRDGEQLMIDYNAGMMSRLSYEDRKALCAQRNFTCYCARCVRKE